MLKVKVTQTHGETLVTCDSDHPDRPGVVMYEYTPLPEFDNPQAREIFEPILRRYLEERGCGMFGHRINPGHATPLDLHAALVGARNQRSRGSQTLEDSEVVDVEILSGQSWEDPYTPNIPPGAQT